MASYFISSMAGAGYLIAIAAYVLMACSQLADKFFLSSMFRDSRAYACFAGLLNILVLGMIPFGLVTLPSSWGLVLLSLLFGASFVLALLPFLSALQGDDASRVIPVVGSLLPIGLFLIERLVYGTILSGREYAAFVLLVTGALVMTLSHKQGRLSFSALAKAVAAAGLFAICFAGSKYVYGVLGFSDAFFWLRIGGFLAGLSLILLPGIKQELSRFLQKDLRVTSAYLGNQGLSATGFVLQNYAIHLTSVSIVSALQGVQYVFLIFFAVLASIFYPKFIREQLSVGIILEKLVAVLIIGAGLALLFL